MLATVDCLGVEAGFFRDVEEIHAERKGFRPGVRSDSARERCANERKNILQREDQSGTAERLQKSAA